MKAYKAIIYSLLYFKVVKIWLKTIQKLIFQQNITRKITIEHFHVRLNIMIFTFIIIIANTNDGGLRKIAQFNIYRAITFITLVLFMTICSM